MDQWLQEEKTAPVPATKTRITMSFSDAKIRISASVQETMTQELRNIILETLKTVKQSVLFMCLTAVMEESAVSSAHYKLPTSTTGES
jgi:hypothetical protein